MVLEGEGLDQGRATGLDEAIADDDLQCDKLNMENQAFGRMANNNRAPLSVFFAARDYVFGWFTNVAPGRAGSSV